MRYLDAAYQLIQKGYINNFTKKNNFDIKQKRIIKKFVSVLDQYILRRMFKPFWVYYTIFLRIISMKVRLKDFKAVIKTRKVEQLRLNKFIKYEEYDSFKSKLINSNPLVSIIIPTLNRYDSLKVVLENLQIKHIKILRLF